MRYIDFININFAEPDKEKRSEKVQKETSVNTPSKICAPVNENEWQMEYRIIYSSYKIENKEEDEYAGW